jgi:hypothetical protein
MTTSRIESITVSTGFGVGEGVGDGEGVGEGEAVGVGEGLSDAVGLDAGLCVGLGERDNREAIKKAPSTITEQTATTTAAFTPFLALFELFIQKTPNLQL